MNENFWKGFEKQAMKTNLITGEIGKIVSGTAPKVEQVAAKAAPNAALATTQHANYLKSLGPVNKPLPRASAARAVNAAHQSTELSSHAKDQMRKMTDPYDFQKALREH